MKNGVPFEVAIGRTGVTLDRLERMAMSITFSELEGGEFDFNTMSWKKK